MAAITVNSTAHVSYSGPNKDPHGGYANFSDGKDYGFSRVIERNEKGDWAPTEDFQFVAHRKREAHHERVTFKSPARSKALRAYFDSL